jgi:hypothetical protein
MRQMDIQILWRNNGYNEKDKNLLEKSKQTLEHISNLSFWSFEWQDMIKKGWPIRCVNGIRRRSYDGWVFIVQECGLSMTLQQLQMKMAKLI